MSIQKEFEESLKILKEGKILLYPTDTVWGLGCDATNNEAVKRIAAIKKREESKPMIILISRIEQLRDYVVKVPDIAWDWVEFAENPLTVIYPQGKNIAREVMASDGSVGIRLIRDEFCGKLIDKLGKPLVSTSANLSGRPFPDAFEDIDAEVLAQADYAVNLKRQERSKSKPSSVVRLELDGSFSFLRK